MPASGHVAPEPLSAQVIDFIASECAIPRHLLSLGSDLESDLGITGDDADDLFAAFAQRFRVRLDGLDLGEYFGAEGCGIWGLFRSLFKPRKRIRIGHLVRIAEAGYWFPPEKCS